MTKYGDDSLKNYIFFHSGTNCKHNIIYKLTYTIINHLHKFLSAFYRYKRYALVWELEIKISSETSFFMPVWKGRKGRYEILRFKICFSLIQVGNTINIRKILQRIFFLCKLNFLSLLPIRWRSMTVKDKWIKWR